MIIIICSYCSDASQFTFLMSLAAAPPSPLAIGKEPDLPPDLLLPISSWGIKVMYEIISLTRYKET